MTVKPTVEIKRYHFNNALLAEIDKNPFVSGYWPLVYILSDGNIKSAYVGETTDAWSRMSTHLKHDLKSQLTVIHLITSDKFNKSATLDIESNLIKYLSGDGQYKLLNANIGLANHTYYQKHEVYWDIFKGIWNKLKVEGLTKNSLEHIDNSDLFKYSPYKSLSSDQRDSIIDILNSVLDPGIKNIIIEGGAGTGKTVLATYLCKLLNTDLSDFSFKEFGDDEELLINKIIKIKKELPNPSMALVIPMSSFRSTIKKVFKNIKGLCAKMVVRPAEITRHNYDIIIVDEAHRLRRRVNLGTYFGAFDEACQRLGFSKDKSNELDWVLQQSKKSIIFYDENQSIKPSDTLKEEFKFLKQQKSTVVKQLKSQFRVKGGIDYVDFVDRLLNCNLFANEQFGSSKYEFQLFDSIKDMSDKINDRHIEYGLSRLVAGFSWKWTSKDDGKNDIFIDDQELKWNSVTKDWINSSDSVNEVGCIHTTQGYDLNYTGLIFGNEISYDKINKEILVVEKNYHDLNGKLSIKNPAELKAFIINIYKTLMLRGIKGTYVYVCDDDLREYFREHISVYEKSKSMKLLPLNEVKPFVNCVPLYDLKAAAGNFSNLQQVSDLQEDLDLEQISELQWVELPEPYLPSNDYFVIKVVGESMNKIIPDNSYCLFKRYNGGTREGKIVLAKHLNFYDSDFGAGYTVKMYHSFKTIDSESWVHNSIILQPQSHNKEYKEIILEQDETASLEVLGIYERVLFTDKA